MNIGDALREGKRLLAAVSREEADFDAELLVRHALGADRARLYQRLGDALSHADERAYRHLLDRRLAHEPTVYLLGHKEFYGLDFEVTPAAIIPRPETETLVELVLAFVRERKSPLTIADIGTGSGVIAVALAHALPQAQLIATDISPQALALAGRNAGLHGVSNRIRFLCGDILNPLDAPVDIITANLPYVRTAAWQALPPEIRDHEPRSGLDGGSDGLRVIERLLQQAPHYLKPGGALLAEIGDEQGKQARGIAQKMLPEARIPWKPI